VAVNLSGKITFQSEKLTARVTATSLRQVLEEISRVSGVQVRWLNLGGKEPVTVDFVALPFSEAIPRLLDERNFVLFYSSTGTGARLTQIWISSSNTGGEQLEGTQQTLSQEQAPLTPTGDDTAEEDVIPPDMLLQTALYDQSPSARLEAIAQLEGCSHQDPRITAALSHLADTDSDPQVQEVAAEALRRLE
jgi:hypothetical protein